MPGNHDDEFESELDEIKRLISDDKDAGLFEYASLFEDDPPAENATHEESLPPREGQISGPPAVRRPPSPPQPGQAPGNISMPQRRRPPSQLQQPQQSLRPQRQTRPVGAGEPGQSRQQALPAGNTAKHPEKEPGLDTGSEEFDVDFDFDEAYRDVPENRPLRLRREKRTGCIGGIMYAAFVICISLVLGSLMWMAAVDVLGFGTDDEQVNIIVKQGFEIDEITDLLYEGGLIRYKFLFNIYAGFSHAEDKITAGSYVLNRNFDYRALVQGMTARAGVRVETTVTIPEGFTLAQIFTLLEDSGVCSASDLWDTATNHNFNYVFLDRDTLGERHRLEGFLFPETYNFYENSGSVSVINRLLNEFNRRFTDENAERAEEMGYSIRDIVNIAAMIEREAGSDEERPRIAAVIYNRLNNPRDFPNLEIDATIHYAIAGTGRPFSTELDDPYNTYIREGLPPGPIANPGMASILAALHPESTNEYFYALNKEGTHNFFRTYAEHQRFVQSDEYGGR